MKQNYIHFLKVETKSLPVFFLMALLIYTSPKANSLEQRELIIADQLRCPTCQGLSVKDSHSGLSLNMKKKINAMLIEGKSNEEILSYFESRYGEWILRSPRKKGFNWLLWSFPGIFFLLASLIVLKYLLKKNQLSKDDKNSKIDATSNIDLKKEFEKSKNNYLQNNG